MLASIEKFFSDLFSNAPMEGLAEHELRLASAALLIFCARADGDLSVDEATKMRELMIGQFDLSGDEADAIIAKAKVEQEDAVDLHGFTRAVRANLDRDGRLQMVQHLWEVANADGVIDNEERQAVALAAQLLDVEVADSVALRRAVEAMGTR